MKLLLDANISWRLGSTLREYFSECVHVDDIPELAFSAKDYKIWQYAKDNGYAIITHDNDFNELAALKGFPPKIILLRTGNCSRKFMIGILIQSQQSIKDFLESDQYGLLEIL